MHTVRYMQAEVGAGTWERASRRLSWHSAKRLSRTLMRLSLSALAARSRCSSPPISAAFCLKAALMMPCATSSFLSESDGSKSAICAPELPLAWGLLHQLVSRLTMARGP